MFIVSPLPFYGRVGIFVNTWAAWQTIVNDWLLLLFSGESLFPLIVISCLLLIFKFSIQDPRYFLNR